MSVKASTAGSLSKSLVAQVACDESAERNKSSGSGDVRNDEPVQVVDNRTRYQLGKWPLVAPVAGVERFEVAVSVALEDDRRRVAETNEDKVEQ